MGTGVLAAALRPNTSLRELHIKGNELGDEGVKALCEALAERKGGECEWWLCEAFSFILQIVLAVNCSVSCCVSRCQCTWHCVITALMFAAGLVAIDLGNNSIGREGAAALAALLRASSSVKEVNVYMNDIGDDGAFQVAAAIKDNRSLTALDLGGNNIGPDGAKALAAALSGNDVLRSLELG